MTNLPYDYDSLPLHKQASYHINMLSGIIEKISGYSDKDGAMTAKKQQQADLSKMIKQWENMGIPVSDELRMMHLSLTADLSHEHEMVASSESIRQLLQELLNKMPAVGAAAGLTQKRRRRNAEAHPKTPLSVFRDQILQVLEEAGGKAASAEVRLQLENRMGSAFTDRDLELCSDGYKPVWWNTAQWERNQMVNEGLLKKDSPRGVWELA